MDFKTKWYSPENKPLEIPTFQDLQNVTGQAFDDFGNYVGKKEMPKQQLVIDKLTQRQYYAPEEYSEDAIRYGKAKIDESFKPKDWYGMTQIKPNYKFMEHISVGYISALKSLIKPIAELPTKLVYTGAVGLNAISRGNFQSAETLYRSSMKNWEQTLDKAGLGADPELQDMLTVKIGSIAGQTASSLLIAAAVSSVGGLPAVAAVFGSQQFADVMEEGLAKGLSHKKAVSVAFQAAVAEGGLEAFGFRLWSGAASMNKSFRNIALGFLWEGAQEGSQQIAESAITNFYGLREQDLYEIMAEVALSALVGGLVGGVGAGLSGQVEQRNIALKKEIGMTEKGNIVTPNTEKKEKGVMLKPSKEAEKQFTDQEIAEAKRTGDNKLYNIIKNIANAHGITDEKIIDKLYPVCRKMVSDGATLSNLQDIIGQQVVAYKNQLDNNQIDKEANDKAVEQIKLVTDPNRVEEWRESRRSELEKIGFTKDQAGTLTEHLSTITQRLSERLGFDITKKKEISFSPNLSERAGTRGQIELGKTVAKVALNKNADPTTVEHEFFHYIDRVVLDSAKEGNAEAQKLVKKRDEIIKKAKAELKKRGIKDMPIDEEILASAYEKWLWQGGKSEDAYEQRLFNAIREFFRDVYDTVKGLMGIRITPEADAYFRAMTGEGKITPTINVDSFTDLESLLQSLPKKQAKDIFRKVIYDKRITDLADKVIPIKEKISRLRKEGQSFWDALKENHKEYNEFAKIAKESERLQLEIAKEIVKSSPDTLFQEGIKYDKNSKADTNSPEFKKWSNNATLVKAENANAYNFETGKSVVVESFHGTNSEFSEFDPRKIGKNYLQSEYGFYFTDRENNYGKINMPVYLRFNNPLVINVEDYSIEFFDENRSDIVREAWRGEHDGIIVKSGKKADKPLFFVFDPTQIKSVYNRGTFDTESPNIYYQQENKDLIATHATKLDNIDALLESGKLVAPSIAITKKGQKELNKGKFGQVVLVMNPLRIKYNTDNIYNRDIYSPRFPSVQYKTELGYMNQSEYNSYKDKWDENQEDFKKKYGGTFDEVIGNEKYFFEGFNERTGNRIYKKYTPLNVLSYLKKESLVGGESFHYGLSSFLAKMSKKIEDRESLREESKQMSDREESQKKYDELSKRYSDLLFGDINKYSKFSEVGEEDFDAFLKYLYEGHPERANEYLEVDKIPESLKKELKDFVGEAVSLPRSYFEMKPMRLVPLNNFVYAVTNKGNLNKEQIAKFESYGIEVKEVDDIKSFDFTSLEIGRENATNVFDVYFQQETNEQLYRNDQALKEGAKVLDKAPTNEQVEKELATIRSGRVVESEPKRGFGLAESIGDFVLTVRQRVGTIDKRLKYAFDKLDFNEKMYESKYGKNVVGYIKKYRKLDDTKKRELDYLILNKQDERIREFVRQNNMLEEYNQARTLLDNLYVEGNKSGMDMGFLQEYFPTKVVDPEGLITYLKGTDKWTEIERALAEIDPNNQMSIEDRANAINNILRGYNRADPISKQGFQNERLIFHKTPEMMKFYAPSDEALMRYVSGMSSALAIRNAFNVKNAFNAEESIGGVVQELIKSGQITYKEEAFIRKMLKARLNYARTAPMVALLKNFGYLGTMNNITSAVTQIGDLYANFYKYNFGTAMKALFGKREITKEDLHIDSIWEEFADAGWTGIAVNKLFSAIGLNKMDAFGKNTSINGAWIDLKERLKNNDISLLEDLSAAFGSRSKQVMEDIKNNNITEDVKLMIWSQLADTQPLGKSGVPVGYLNNPHGRIIYQLKTYTINQLSLFYADGIYKINKGLATKNKKLFLQGVGNTAKLALLLTIFNAGADALKNLIMGRKIDISDTLLSNMLWNIGVSKYTFYRGQRDGYARALLENYLLPPQISMGDDAYMDVKKIATGKRKPSDTIAVTYVPFGRMWYWWFGGGRTQEKKKGNKPFEVEL